MLYIFIFRKKREILKKEEDFCRAEIKKHH